MFRDKPPWWGGDLQTIRNSVVPLRTNALNDGERLEFITRDSTGDRLVGALSMPKGPRHGPLIVLIHGLTGDQESPYMRRSTHFHVARGRRVLRLNLRGAGPSRAVANGFYFGGCVDDIRDVLTGLPPHLTTNGVFAVGFSLGGNILVNVLGQAWAKDLLIGAATVSAPLEPAAAADQLMARRNRLYHRHLMSNMRAEFLHSRAKLSPDEHNAISAASSVRALDDAFTAPRNGYTDVGDYYTKTAGTRFMFDLPVPTLLIHARNDPWIPVDPYETLQAAVAPNAKVLLTQSGGHVGFHERGFKYPRHDRAIDAFLQQYT